MTQLELPPHVYSQTSRAAAEAIRPDTSRLRALVLGAIEEHGGLTDEEGIDATGIAPSTYRPRRIELVQRGLVADSGHERKTRSGRWAVVWIKRQS